MLFFIDGRSVVRILSISLSFLLLTFYHKKRSKVRAKIEHFSGPSEHFKKQMFGFDWIKNLIRETYRRRREVVWVVAHFVEWLLLNPDFDNFYWQLNALKRHKNRKRGRETPKIPNIQGAYSIVSSCSKL